MIQIVLHRGLSVVIACSDGMQWVRGDTSHGWQDKSTAVGWVHVVGAFLVFASFPKHRCHTFCSRHE
jgi:hypothetical protein